MFLDQVRIVLVEPAGPLNVGSIARVMKNMGLSQLVLVNPQCDRLSVEARQMAVHAAELLETAQEVKTLPEALQGCQRTIATTGRSHTTLSIPLEQPRAALPWLLTNAGSTAPPSMSALMFGREDHGLTNEELNYAQRLVLIPAHPGYVSLNLAQAVAICCYELYVYATTKAENPQGNSPSPPCFFPDRSDSSELATFDALEGYYQHLETLLLRIGYLYPHTAASRMEKLRRLFSRSYPSATEVAMLRGMLSQMEWALEQNEPS